MANTVITDMNDLIHEGYPKLEPHEQSVQKSRIEQDIILDAHIAEYFIQDDDRNILGITDDNGNLIGGIHREEFVRVYDECSRNRMMGDASGLDGEPVGIKIPRFKCQVCAEVVSEPLYCLNDPTPTHHDQEMTRIN